MRATYPKVPEINILPEEYRWRPITRLQLALLLLALAGLVGAFLSYRSLETGRDEMAVLRAEQRRLLAAADELAPQAKQAESLRKEIDQLKKRLEAARKAQESLSVQRLDWDSLLPPLFLSLPPGIELRSLTQQGLEVKIDGASSAGYPPLSQYYQQLRGLPGVTRVTVDRAVMVKEGKEGGQSLTFTLKVRFKGG